MKITNVTKNSFTANKMSKAQAQLINKTLTNSKGVDIICHDLTDKDAANSALLMWEYLNQKGVNSRVILYQNLDSLHLRNPNCNINMANSYDTNPIGDTALCVDFSAIGRMHPNTIDTYNNAKNTVCIDHHTNEDLFSDGDYVELKKPLDDSELPKETSLHYIDSSAKSATSIIYRFFEALDEEIDEDRAYDIMQGLVSDGVKRGLFVCDGTKGIISPKDELKNDKNTYEIYNHLVKILPEEKMQQIAKNIDIMANLTPKEKDFYDSLFTRLEFSKDNKTAYVEISPDDDEWVKMGGDTGRNSNILNRFRRSVLYDDKKYPNLKNIIVFYSAGDTYRLSIHSKNRDLVDFYTYAYEKLEDKYDLFSIGGHKSRGGGKILPEDKAQCHEFAQDVIDCIQNYK